MLCGEQTTENYFVIIFIENFTFPVSVVRPDRQELTVSGGPPLLKTPAWASDSQLVLSQKFLVDTMQTK